MCKSLSLSLCLMCVEPVKDKRRGKIPREPELQEVVSLLVWMMGTDCWYPIP